MIDRIKSKQSSRYLVLMIVFLLLVTLTLGYLLMRQAKHSIITLMQTRMLDISNTAAAMIDGDTLRAVTPADKGTDGYESIMRTLTYFQDNVQLRYIYCIRDNGDGSFSFGLDPTVEDPGEFGSPIVYTEALHRASQGKPSVDDKPYKDAWGSFYSAYSPVFDSRGKVAGIIAADFDAEWYNQQLATLTRTTIVVALLSLLIGAGIVMAIITSSQKKIEIIHEQLNEMEATLKEEMIQDPVTDPDADAGEPETGVHNHWDDDNSMDGLQKQIQTMQTELKSHIAHVHVQAYQDGLTGVKSKHAYLQMENMLNERIEKRALSALAVVVCDLNGLKKINDTLGHQAGDEYIREACRMICEIFAHSPVYRIGGDEFAVILTGRDYDNRERLMHELHRQSSSHISTHEAIVSGGMAEYIPGKDHFIHEIFERADGAMYEEKTILKNLGAVTREEEEEKDSGQTFDFEDILADRIRKHILIADDISTNREILGDLLREDYEVLYAADGQETLEMLRNHKDEIALLILDLYMPKVDGREVLTRMQVDEELVSVPVIVLTIDQQAELDCLKLGAMDFIPKPYPDIEIVKARIAKCIELSENRDLIRNTQSDKLTGLFNIDYFIRYVDLFDKNYKDEIFDAVVCEVNRFHSLNEQYGRQFGDLVLRSIGIRLRKLARKTGGIGCRQGGDTFLLYCRHQEDYEKLFKRFMDDLFVEKETADKVSLRFGVYVDAGQEADIEERFACAGIAADSIKNDPQKIYGLYQL